MPLLSGKNGGTGLLVGTGILGWPPSERESGRYGILTLWTEHKSHPLMMDYVPAKRIHLQVWRVPKKHVYCDLFALYLEQREFVNTGDPHRGYMPTRVGTGRDHKLGRGLLFYPDDRSVGVQPYPMVEGPWLDPNELYKLIDQLVTLYIVPNPT